MLSLLDYLERTASRFPDKIAFADEKESVSFAKLVEIGKDVGTAIAREVGGLRLPVALLTNHSVADIAAFIGVLYAGCFFIPMDSGAPKEHIASRLSALNPAMTIEISTLAALPRVSTDEALLADIRLRILSTDPAYAIFTSGSTGVPKAAIISHGSSINLAEWLGETFCFSDRTVYASQAPFYYDAALRELFSTLRDGSTMHLIPRRLFSFPLALMRRVEEVGANVLQWVTAATIIAANSGVFDRFVPKGIEEVIFGGENLTGKILNIWKKAMPDARFCNMYGPTETTVACTYYFIDREFADGESVPIGFPCRDFEISLLDEYGNPVSVGEPGEIYVRGSGVGLGYYNDTIRTSEAFVQNPTNPSYRDIVYRTGDIAKRNDYGELVFLSRADQQVKHMGNRVELGEVETAAAGLGGIRLACCSYDRENRQILLFFEGTVTERDITESLNSLLPHYMLPNIVIKMDKMPAMPNGKIDRLRLLEEYRSGL